MYESELFAALAHPIRLRILSLLQARKEICVCDLCEVFDVLQPRVSRHLGTLRDAGFVEVRSDGKWKFYSLARPASPLHRSLLGCVRQCLNEVEELATDRTRLESIDATQPSC